MKKRNLLKRIFPFEIVSKKRFCLFILDIVLLVSLIFSSFHPEVWNFFSKKVNQAAKNEIVDPVKKASAAAGQFTPTNGQLRNGSEQTITSATAASSNGTNVGSWKATFADDDFQWVIGASDGGSPGYDLNLTVGGVQLSGANMMMIETEVDLDATIPQTNIEICDWVSSTGVDEGVDSDCDPATGGWRILNLRKALINTATSTQYHYQIYDGYWSDGSNAPRSTPLTNFVSPSGEVKVRYVSTTPTNSVVAIDFLRIYAVINPVYSPADFTDANGAGSVTGDYTNTIIASGGYSDNNRNGASGTAGSVADFYWTFKNAKTYTGMNTIVVRAETGCSSNGGTSYRPRIYNDTSATWEDISANNISCSTTDATNIWSFTPATFDDYVNASNEIKIGFKGQLNSTYTIYADFIYMMIGTTNTDSNKCEVSFGSGTATDCANTRDIDTTGIASEFNNPAEDESTNQGHSYYPGDNDQDAVAEEAGAAHVKFSVTQPADSAITGLFFASRHMSGTTGSVQASLRIYSGSYAGTGGFSDVGATGSASLNYTDNITVGTLASGGMPGVINSPEEYIDTVGNEMWMRLRTSTDPSAASNVTNQWDFAFVSIQWIEDATRPSKSYQFTTTDASSSNGTAQNVNGVNAGLVQGRNVGTKGVLADDSYHWEVAGDTDGTPGLTMNFTLGNAQLNGANAILIQSEVDMDATVHNLLFQICDWVDNTGVDAAVDGECDPATGGWRTYNLRKAAYTYEATSTSSATPLHYQIYNGFWSDGSNTPIDTPLSNFINGSNEIKIRYISTTSSTSVVSVDYLRVFTVINPFYMPADLETIGAGAVTGDYTNAILGMCATGSDCGADDVYSGSLAVADETAPNSYWSFKNIETYTGMNSIVVRSQHSCAAAAGAAYRPQIYNFTTTSWTDLSTGTIACSTSDNTSEWAFTPNSLTADYISSGEMRIGFKLISGTPTTLRADYMYLIAGTTNTDSNDCEISFGSGTTSDCANTRTLDTTGALSTWDITKEDESTDFSHTYYPFDNDGDANLEEAAAGHIKFDVSAPSRVTGIFYGLGFVSGAGYNTTSSGTIWPNLFDYSGFSGTYGGFSTIGYTSSVPITIALGYMDNLAIGITGNMGIGGVFNNASDYLDYLNDEIWMRFRTGAAAGQGAHLPMQIDFALVSIQWIE